MDLTQSRPPQTTRLIERLPLPSRLQTMLPEVGSLEVVDQREYKLIEQFLVEVCTCGDSSPSRLTVREVIDSRR